MRLTLLIKSLLCIGGVLFYALLGCSSNPEKNITFNHVIIDSAPPAATGCCLDVCAIGDIDHDGKADIMVGSENSIGAVWYHSPSWTRYVIGEGSFTTDGEIFDMDGDGDGDVVLSCISRDVIEWWENTGNPFDGGWVRHEIGDLFAHDLAVADINGDKRPDVVMFKKGEKKQLTWFQSPRDPKNNWIRHEIASPDGEGLDVGDIDGDGDLDIAGSRNWYENVNSDGLSWHNHTINDAWGVDCRDIIVDMNGDGKNDIILSESEGKGGVSWFENPSWKEHKIETDGLTGAHSLEVGDFDKDGDPDVFTGEMHTSAKKRILVYENLGGGTSWVKRTLETTGTHNARIGDIDGDGDIDIVGKNYDGKKVVEIWENTITPHPKFSPKKWTYIQVDDDRDVYRNRIKAFGLAMGDLTGDAYGDIASGRYFYRNPGADMTGKWERITFPVNVDAVLIVDVDGDELGDVIGQALPDVYWLEAKDIQGNSWNTTKIGTIAKTGHENGQGYAVAQIIPGGKPELILKGGSEDNEVYYFEIPDNPEVGNWPHTLITNESTDEGVGVGDIDGDGDIDICGGGLGGKAVGWWENPGTGKGQWMKHIVGSNNHWADRFALADINEDGRLDIVMSEEWRLQGSRVYWYEQPDDPKSPNWPRHVVAYQFTTNSMDVADMDHDGDIDIITGEHRGTEKLTVWENVNKGSKWIEHVISTGKESHLGASVADLDGDGDMEIASIAWDDYQYLHLWRNDARKKQLENLFLLPSLLDTLMTSFYQ